MKFLLAWSRLLPSFAMSWISSHLRVLFLSLSPKALWEPGSVEYLFIQKLSERQLMWIAHLITATPGTLTVEIAENRKSLTIHMLESNDSTRNELLKLVRHYERNLSYAG